MKLSTIGIPLLLGLAAVFFLADGNVLTTIQIDNIPEEALPPGVSKPSKQESSKPKSTEPKRSKPKPRGYGQCIALSNKEYQRDMAEFNWIRKQPEIDYGRLRDDRYGKGLNTITREKLAREKQCLECGSYWQSCREVPQ